MDDGTVPPMMPEDFAALAAFAGPLYQESKLVESFTSENPIPGAHRDYGSMNIRQGLEQAQNLARASAVRPQPMYVPPAVPLEQPDITTGTASFAPYPTLPVAHNPQLPTPDPSDPSDQLEFAFNTSEQIITNDLLRDISKSLKKVISLLEKEKDGDTLIPKLKPNVPIKKNQV